MNTATLLKNFAKLYPNPRSELNFTGEYQLICSVVLSAQCTDKKVNEVTPALFKLYPDFLSLAKAKLSELESIIRPINYYRTKAKNLIALGASVSKDFNSKLPSTIDELITLPGVGRKTASVVLSELGVAETFPVDTHVFRVSQRLGLAKGKNPEQIEAQLKAKFQAKDWRNLHHWLIFHGRRVCKAQNPLCKSCQLAKSCPASNLATEY